jgi:hypothetical protein
MAMRSLRYGDGELNGRLWNVEVPSTLQLIILPFRAFCNHNWPVIPTL